MSACLGQMRGHPVGRLVLRCLGIGNSGIAAGSRRSAAQRFLLNAFCGWEMLLLSGTPSKVYTLDGLLVTCLALSSHSRSWRQSNSPKPLHSTRACPA